MSQASHPHVNWRGGTTCVRAAAMLTGMVVLLAVQGRAGIANGITLAQGSYRPWSKYSANTHAGCGVVDISRWNSVTGNLWTQAEWACIVAAARQVGFAAWHRFAIKDLWVEHTHCVAIGCPDLNVPDATDQVTSYRNGHDGLASNGSDNGPRNWVSMTWESHLDTLIPLTLEDEDMASQKYLYKFAGHPAVFFGDLETCRWVKTEAEAADINYETRTRFGNTGLPVAGPGVILVAKNVPIRVLGRKELIGVIEGDVPPGWAA